MNYLNIFNDLKIFICYLYPSIMIKINLQILEKICFICSWSHHGAGDETGVGSAILISGSEEKL